MGGKRAKKKQVQVRTIATRASPLPLPSPVSTIRADDLNESGIAPEGGAPEDALADDGVSRASMKGGCGKLCRHLERGVNLDKLSCQLGKSKITLTQCQDCTNDGKAGMGKKSKGRSARKKAFVDSASQDASHQAQKWVCLACGHVGCGAISTAAPAHLTDNSVEQEQNVVDNIKEDGVATGHAWRHSLLAKHPLALQSGDKLVCWCFVCNVAVDCCFPLASSSELQSDIEDGRQLVAIAPPGSAPLQQAVKLVREKLVKESVFFNDPGRIDQNNEPLRTVMDAVLNPIPIDTARSLIGHYSGSERKRVVKGLMNLGNTCFFNSVMQNLLALDLLREYFSQDSQVVEGPLTSSLRRLYLETNSDGPSFKASGHSNVSGFESGMKRCGKNRVAWESSGAYNPRSLFGAICAKAPRFRGFQQQDSHELLRCLLEGLNSEERSMRVTEAESRKGAGMGRSSARMQADDQAGLESLEEQDERRDTENQLADTPKPTLVENLFGGQLSSTVRCCECGHSSVVYEPILDLSLQIPTRQALKKCQTPASQGTLSSHVDRFEKGPSRRDSKNARALQKIDAPEALHGSTEREVENKKVPSEVLYSALTNQNDSSASEKVNASIASPNDNPSLDEFGWLDFVGGGIQSAEGSLRESHDILKETQTSENALSNNVEGNLEANVVMDVLESFSFDNKSSLQSIIDAKSVVLEGTDESVGTSQFAPAVNCNDASTCPATSLHRSSGTGVHGIALVDAPTSGQGDGDENLVAQPLGEDEPFSLISGVLYEPLKVPSDWTAEERVDCRGPVNCSLDEISCFMQAEDKDMTSGLPLEQDGLDGFSQLFEQEESLPLKDQRGEGEDRFQAAQDSSLDGRWNADIGALVGEESDQIIAGSQKIIEHLDAILPMSLEGCLADFTKSELLYGENAWECESCSQQLKNMTQLPLEEGKMSLLHPFSKGVGQEEGGGKLGKEKSQMKHNSTGKGVSSCSNYANGNVDHATRSMSMCPHNGNGQVSTNGNTEDVSDVTGKVVVDSRMGNGGARLNELDSGQLSGSQSRLYQTDNEVNTHFHQENCTEMLGYMPPKESLCADKCIGKDEAGIHCVQCEQAGTSLSVQSCGDVQMVCMQGDAHSGISYSVSEEKLAGPFRIPGKTSKLQKGRSRKSQPETQKSVKRDAIKKFLISKAPPILTIHLKRFAQDMRGRLNKLSGHVSFPEVLDLRPFLDPKCPDLDKCIFQLVGIVEHGGTMRGGHYIAYVRGPPEETTLESDAMDHGRKNAWYCVSDSSVRKSTLQAVLNSEAYLLFYEKCKFI